MGRVLELRDSNGIIQNQAVSVQLVSSLTQEMSPRVDQSESKDPKFDSCLRDFIQEQGEGGGFCLNLRSWVQLTVSTKAKGLVSWEVGGGHAKYSTVVAMSNPQAHIREHVVS